MADDADSPADSADLVVLRGRVLTPSGEPAADARVALAAGPQAQPDIAALTGDDGTFAFGGLSPGRYRVEAYSDLAHAVVEVDAVSETAEPVVMVVRE